MHALIKVMSESKMVTNSQARGYIGGEGELSTAMGSIRRFLY